MTGAWPKHQIDHHNLDKADNRWRNLREATRSQNQANRRAHSNSRSGIKGVYLEGRSGRWRAQVQHKGRTHNLGRFDTAEEARAAYATAAAATFGEYARII